MMQFAHRPKLKWNPLNERRRRVWCGLCRYDCGGLFDVPDDVWLHYVGEEQRHQVLCIGCWHWLVDAIDGGEFEAGGPAPMWNAGRAGGGSTAREPRRGRSRPARAVGTVSPKALTA